jgi:hypothetical protein
MKTITTLLITLICSISFGQNFTGKIIDTQNQPISFANIVVKDKTDDSLITGVISDENAEYSIHTKKENVKL